MANALDASNWSQPKENIQLFFVVATGLIKLPFGRITLPRTGRKNNDFQPDGGDNGSAVECIMLPGVRTNNSGAVLPATVRRPVLAASSVKGGLNFLRIVDRRPGTASVVGRNRPGSTGRGRPHEAGVSEPATSSLGKYTAFVN
jgi:hypothetical protein